MGVRHSVADQWQVADGEANSSRVRPEGTWHRIRAKKHQQHTTPSA